MAQPQTSSRLGHPRLFDDQAERRLILDATDILADPGDRMLPKVRHQRIPLYNIEAETAITFSLSAQPDA